ncbi:hypothetical protein QVD17_06001 [Tagetes erecta]|uniref:Cysteine/Histidine-rich C1 domain family protein n=1 Tax=Tagetes erecta TaxID=13708 RepID=A0AAD8PBX8_TARER|nr:hypothetical protein QVD17_06001 [Tagetes erecta]
MMKVFEHDHPLKLIDLQVSDIEDVEESDDEEDELVIADEFSCTCKRCHKDINEYSRYYYTCTNDSCDFSLHKFCTELPTTIKYLSCPDPLTFNPHGGADWSCGHCNRHHKGNESMLGKLCRRSVCLDLQMPKMYVLYPSRLRNVQDRAIHAHLVYYWSSC